MLNRLSLKQGIMLCNECEIFYAITCPDVECPDVVYCQIKCRNYIRLINVIHRIFNLLIYLFLTTESITKIKISEMIIIYCNLNFDEIYKMISKNKLIK